MNKIELFLENLNFREKFLISFFICLCAIFFAMKFYDSFLYNILKNTLIEYEYSLLTEERKEIKQLQSTTSQLYKQIKNEQEINNRYTQILKSFLLDSKLYIDNIKDLSNDLILNDFKFSYKDYKLLQYNTIFLNLNGDFYQILNFIQNLENSKLIYQIHSLEINNLKKLNLYLKLKISFISLSESENSKS